MYFIDHLDFLHYPANKKNWAQLKHIQTQTHKGIHGQVETHVNTHIENKPNWF